MKKKLIGALTLALAGTMALGLAACKKDKTEVHDDILNGGFEQGFTGWTKSGTAFSQSGVVETDVVGPDGGKITAGKVGKYFFSGFDAGNAQFTGTLTSDPFVLGGTGKIGFLMGGGMNKEKCYVEFFEEGNDTALLKVANEAFDIDYITGEMVRVVADLSAHVGKTVYIKITDDDKGDADEYAYLNLDDFVVYKTDAEVEAAEKERADKLYEIGKPTFSEDPTSTTIKNGGFEEMLHNWKVLEGDAFLGKSLYNSADKFWDVRSYNAEGERFLCTYYDESRIGAIRSTKFTLAGDGVISFLMAGAKNDGSYVAVCDGDTDEELTKVTFDKFFNDPNLSENMVRFYVKLTDRIGDVLYIKVVDGERTDFAGICVDDFKVSMTEAETKAQMKADYEWAMTLGDDAVAKKTQEYYSNGCEYPAGYELSVLRFETKVTGKAIRPSGSVDLTAYLSEAKAILDSTAQENDFTYAITSVTKDGAAVSVADYTAVDMSEAGLYTVTYTATYDGKTIEETFFVDVAEEHSILNGGFEAGSLAGWEVIEGADKVNTAAAASNAYYGFTNAPYNQAGNYHFDGAAAAEESATYTLRSSDFVLGGAGIISFKLGGNAARLRVIDKTSGVILAEFTNTKFSDTNNPHVELGCRNLTMTTYYYDLSRYLGLTMYIEVSDTASSGWGVLHFDDVVTYYATGTTAETLAAKKDTVIYTCEGGEDPFDIAWETAENTASPNLLQITQKAAEYVEVDAKDLANINLASYLTEVRGAVIGEADPEITAAEVSKITCGDGETTEDLATYEFEAGKTYVITYKITYTDEEETLYTAEASFILKTLKSGDIHNGSFEKGDLTGWTVEGNGANVSSGSVYWEGDANFFDQNGVTVQTYQKEGNYFLVTDEGQTVTVKSETFTITEDYISFKFGIAKNAVSYVALCEATTGAEIVKVTNNTVFSDPTLAQIMLRRFINVSALKNQGVQVYIKIVDGATSDFGFLDFDDLRVNMTSAEATALLNADKAWAQTYRQDVLDSTADMGAQAKNIINAIRSYYTNLTLEGAPTAEAGLLIVSKTVAENAELSYADIEGFNLTNFIKERVTAAVVGAANPEIVYAVTAIKNGDSDVTVSGFVPEAGNTYAVTYTVSYTKSGSAAQTFTYTFNLKVLVEGQILNGGFETGDLEGWTTSEGMTGGVISAQTYWDQKLPYNQSGNYHLDGWNTGIDEGGTWSVKSEVFTLKGAGIITLRMGGNAAAVKVYTVADGGAETLVGYYKPTRFSDTDYPHIKSDANDGGGSWADMVTYIIDLSEYKEQKIRIELCDVTATGWAHAFFDEVVTYYADDVTVDSLKQNKDTFNDATRVGGTESEAAQGNEITVTWTELEDTKDSLAG